MKIEGAQKIKELKKYCTYRRLAEIIYPENDPLHGNQGAGEELCREALKVLYPDDDVWMMYMPEQKFGKDWFLDNVSAWCSKRLEEWEKAGGDLADKEKYDLYFWWE